MTVPPTMSDQDWDRAEKEGWSIGVELNIFALSDLGKKRFKDDTAAEKYILTKARNGSKFHRRVLAYLTFRRFTA